VIRHRTGTARSGPPPDRPPTSAPPTPPVWRNWLLIAGLVLTVVLFLLPVPTAHKVEQLSYSQLKSDVAAGQVASVALGADGSVSGKLTNGTRFTSSFPISLQDQQFAQLLDDHKVQVTTQAAGTSIWSVLLNLFPLAVIVGLFVWSGRAARRQLAGMSGVGRARSRVFDAERPDTTFADVAGYEGAKREVTEVVDFLKYPDRYRRAGAVGPKGVLMVGPPGTGKTLLARAVAGEAHVPFISVTGSSFVELFVGVGAARVRDLFEEARKRAPSIVFIDEIDAIGQRRGGQLVSNDERDQTLNQLLAELDGFDPATGVVVMAATNRPRCWTPRCCDPAASTARSSSPCRPSGSARRSFRCTPPASRWARMWTWRWWPAAPPASPAPTWPTW
jgi:cell division protease FtsH